jgi:hypothetical protein
MHSGQAFLVEKFDGENFHLWKFKIQMILEEKDLWDVVTGSSPFSSGSENDAWIKKERKALATMCLYLKDTQLLQVRQCTTAKEAWKKLTDIYENKSLTTRLFLRRRFFTIQMTEGTSMMDHIAKVRTLAEKLEAIGAAVHEDDVVMTLLSSLPESFSNLITSLESRADSLSLEFVTSRLVHEEARRREVTSSKEESAFLIENNGRKGQGERFNKKACFYCGKLGHFKFECRKRLGDIRNGDRVKNTTEERANAVISK